MTAPAGAVVKLYVDLVAPVAPRDVIETQTGRRYSVLSVRVQLRGARAGRQHLQCLVLGVDDPPTGEVHKIRWYKRGRKARK